MKKEKIMREKFSLMEKELVTLTEKLAQILRFLKDIQDIQLKIKGLKVFLGRVHPSGVQTQFSESRA
ncbi:MAG: hypothetical protein ABSA46_00635 [Thermodesulfovibrionales bacterium]